MEEMSVKVVGLTTTDKNIIENTTIKDFELNGGHSANICYTQRSYEEILKEPIEKTITRANGNKVNGHHSVFGHDTIQLYFENVPKIITMMLNNEHEYNTSEKSGRYTIMYGSEKENQIYKKWMNILVKEIKTIYPNEKYLTENMIKKKAQENCRYLLSIFIKTKFKYTTNFRQLNYLYDFTCKMINETTTNPLKIALKPYLEEFKETLYSTGFITNDIRDYRNREFSLIKDNNSFDEQFGRSYSVNYDSTIPALADLLRHRSLDYSFSLKDKKEFYVPIIIREKIDLVNEWLNDISSINEFPQGMIVNVNETGKYEDFIMKLYERLCSVVQLEVQDITKNVLTKYINYLSKSNSLSDRKIYEELIKYSNNTRCSFPNFECTEPCGFKDGIKLIRRI